MPSSPREPEKNDLQVYGIHAYHQTLRWYSTVDLTNGVADISQGPASPSTHSSGVGYDGRPMPTIKYSPGQLEQIRVEITRSLRLTETDSSA
ncbi:uncharacterized protein B0J16DRAFT_339520 [Fusarium flagelliforme]|uniref:uncharacterized protein n=1 Tax=Fusarium flagelliforme TaxID=2675880 RepID=UPI001E8D7A76|nr:uncharacterized protein B0J16DRAFT_339520 [Fusarium flagelliforme]KAH7189396.1 hypothetical protein B0J16DRAFT_339520 [Fusarium flagelliforme]